MKHTKLWSPGRRDIIWIDFNPHVGLEMKDYTQQPKSFDWRKRGAKPHPMKQAPVTAFRSACDALNQIVLLC
ncbi:hypothetical protein [Duganella guangzhouensis]|uniref:hypothetical protein n=1 Tax=Duganella guangzhouensis TaxID=2666084 RepID=UPI0018A23053|nr:hypothetical protein [Duganella guangzhouensis]